MAYICFTFEGLFFGYSGDCFTSGLQMGLKRPGRVLFSAVWPFYGWGLYLQGYSELGVHTWATNAYYWNNGEGKYSKLALDRYHPANNPTGSYPRLTTTAGENNFRNSSFWLKNTSFFRMKNVELSYTFNQFSPSSVVKKMKVFARGANLFVLSSVKDLDPELLNAGVTNYPVTRTFTGGVSFVF